MRSVAWTLLLTISVAGLLGCQPSSDSDDAAIGNGPSNRIVAVSQPLQEFARALVGEGITVDFPASSAEDPRSFRPDRDAIAKMQKADWIVTNGTGATYAKWLVTVSLPDSRMIPTATKGLSLDDYIAVEDVRLVHSHGPEGEHSHATMVSRTWLNPEVARKQVKYLSERLQQAYPAQKDEIASREEQLRLQLEELDEAVNEIRGLESKPATVLTATHELKFLTKALGWNDRHLNLTPGGSTDDCREAIEKMIGPIKESERPTVLLVPSSFGPLCDQEKTLLDEFKLTRLEIDMIDLGPGDYFQRMKANLKRLKDAF